MIARLVTVACVLAIWAMGILILSNYFTQPY